MRGGSSAVNAPLSVWLSIGINSTVHAQIKIQQWSNHAFRIHDSDHTRARHGSRRDLLARHNSALQYLLLSSKELSRCACFLRIQRVLNISQDSYSGNTVVDNHLLEPLARDLLFSKNCITDSVRLKLLSLKWIVASFLRRLNSLRA